MEKTIEIPEGYKARIEGNKVILERKESEDNRIRREMIEYFHGCIHRNKKTGFRVEQIKGWLAYLERQKEQKPAEWSDENKYILEDAITAIDMHLTDEFKEIHPNLFKAFLAAKDFLKSLPERFNLQSKQEWSEEDKMHLANAILAAEKEWGINSCTVKFLKSLRPSWNSSEEQPEVDLDAEIAIYLNRNVLNRINNADIIEDFTTMEAGELAEHFYELGLKARKV